MSNYRRVSTVPAYIRYQPQHETPRNEIPTDIKWSHMTFDVPAVGDTVRVRINRIGPSRVIGYFVDDGFLGLLVRPLAPPEWFVKQNGRFSECHVFGSEIEPLTDDPASRVTARVVRHRDPIDHKRDRYTVQVRKADGSLLLDGTEKRRDPELAVKLAEKFCARNQLTLFCVEFPS